ncbi:MAG: hypothetical protein HZB16_21360 [Armatimonadetes bacterium]|nr:hypothetical protein [Armatimonadota bacterium]
MRRPARLLWGHRTRHALAAAAVLWLAAAPVAAQVVVEPAVVDLGRDLPSDSAVVRLVALRNLGRSAVALGAVTGDSVVTPRLMQQTVTTTDPTALSLVVRPPRGLRRPFEYRGQVTVTVVGGATLRVPITARFVPAKGGPRPLPDEVYGPPYAARAGSQRVTAVVFYGGQCAKCLDQVDQVVEPLRRYFAAAVRFEVYDTQDRANLALMYRYRDRYRGAAVASVTWFVGRHMLPSEQIDRRPFDLLTAEINHPTQPPREVLLRRPMVGEELRGMSPVTVGFAGLLDGLNPCAFATAVFLVALLTRLGHRRRVLLAAGTAFALAVFTTYLLLGLGVLRALGAVGQRVAIGNALRWAVAALIGGVACGQLADARALARGGATRELRVQLPTRLRQWIHAALRRGLSGPWAVLGAGVAGLVVTLLEAVCTSQVYLPILVGLQMPATRDQALPLLVLYNVGFTAPLVGILVLTWCGVGSERLASLARRHLGLAKALMGLALIGLALWLVSPELTRLGAG